MSWGIDHTGTREGVTKSIGLEMDRIAASYADQQEGQDITMIKGRILELVRALDLTGDYVNGVNVKANGSHSIDRNGLGSADFTVRVSRVHLKL